MRSCAIESKSQSDDVFEWLLENHWKLQPHTFAEEILGDKWTTYRHIKYLSDLITKEISKGNARIIVEAPPRHGKSHFISKVVPSWFIENNPDKNVILASYGDELATGFGRDVKAILSHEKLLTTLSDDSTSKKRWHTVNGGGMYTTGVGGALTGKGFHLGIIDDPIKNWQEAISPTKRQAVKDWYDSTFYTRREPGGSIIVLSTRWHEDDLIGYLLKEHSSEKWIRISLPALAEENDLLGRAPGEALCPERLTVEDLLTIKENIGLIKWNALYRQNPSSLEGGIIKRNYFKFYKVAPQMEEIIQSWDMAFGESASSSFVVGQVWGKHGADLYLLDQIRDRMDFIASLDAIKLLSGKWPKAFTKLIENKANGPAIIASLQKTVSGILAWPPKGTNFGSKEARLQSVSPYFEAGNVYLPDPSIAPWVKDYIEELVNFPHCDDNDQVDSTSQALIRFKLKASGEFSKEFTKKSSSKIVRNEDY